MADRAILIGGELIRAFDNGDGTFALAGGAINYRAAKSGELAGTAAATQLPDVTCRLVRFKGRVDNAGNVYLGGAGVTLPNGATDATTGMEVLPGEDTG